MARDVEYSVNVRVSLCTNCDGIHVELLDEDNQNFAQFVLEPDDVVAFAQTLMQLRDEVISRTQHQTGSLQ